MACNKTPPSLEDESHYEQWRRNIEVWVELTDLTKAKQALAIHMALKGRAQAASSELTISELKADDGVKKLLAKLDGLFLRDEGRRQFASFRNMYRYRRDPSEDVDTFVSNFEHEYFKLKGLKVTLPETVLAFMLLEACDLEDKEEQIVLSSLTDSAITFEHMKAALKRIFGGKFSQTKSNVKVESTFYNEADGKECEKSLYARGANSYRSRGGRSRGYAGRGSNSNSANMARGGNYQGQRSRGGYRGNNLQSFKHGNNRKQNPVDQQGNILKCLICESIFHFAKDCQHSHENIKLAASSEKQQIKIDDSENVQLSLLVAYTGEEKSCKLSKLVSESSCAAILDCGASTSVCGEAWLNDYLGNLTEQQHELVKEKQSNTTFTFGDGVTYKSLKCVNIPCWIANKLASVEMDVVKCNIPLLLSKKAMKRGKMVMNFDEDTVKVGSDIVKLEETNSGHYKMPLKF